MLIFEWLRRRLKLIKPAHYSITPCVTFFHLEALTDYGASIVQLVKLINYTVTHSLSTIVTFDGIEQEIIIILLIIYTVHNILLVEVDSSCLSIAHKHSRLINIIIAQIFNLVH